MLRRFRAVWVCLLLTLLAGGYYLWGELGQNGPLAEAQDPADAADQPYQQFWSQRLGPETVLTYHLQFGCGHDQLFTPEQLVAGGLDVLVDNFDQVVRTMQVEAEEGRTVTLSGHVPIDCPDCRRCYLITEQDGCVAVYRGRDKSSAVLIKRYTDMPIGALPADVQQRLRAGIIVDSEEELTRVLESLDS